MKILRDSRGIALVVVILMMVILLSITGASLLFSGFNLKITRHLKTTSAAIHVADAGIQHALAVIPAGTQFDTLLQGSVTGFPCANPCNGNSNKATLTGSLSGYTYTVVAENDPAEGAPTNDSNKIITLTSEATGPNSSRRKVKAYIGRMANSFVPPGAVYVPGNTSTDSDFNTSGTFFVTGSDTSYTDSDANGRADSTGTGAQSPIYGVAAGNQTVADEFKNSLSSAEKSRVQGKDYNGTTSPATPSIGVPTTTIDVNEVATNFINQIASTSCPPKCLSGLEWNSTDCPSTNPCRLGTDSSPQITYIKQGSDHIHFDGYVYGSGVLVVEGKAHFYGNFEFHGLVIAIAPGGLGGSTEEDIKLKLKNNARIFGHLMLGPNSDDLKFDIKDTAAVYYSSQALSFVQTNWGSLLPQPPRLVAWQEVMQ
ncbi:MAG TPA: hypothetical protein VIK64_18545 [Anaerolineales bacterium]